MTKCKVSDPPFWVKSSKTPDWAKAIAADCCKAKGLTLIWHKASTGYVSGTAWSHGKCVQNYGESTRINGPVIVMNVGKRAYSKQPLQVLLHEIAHINVGAGHGHDKVFLKEVVRLYRKYEMLQEIHDHCYVHYACERKAIMAALKRSDAAKKRVSDQQKEQIADSLTTVSASRYEACSTIKKRRWLIMQAV